MSFAAAMMHAVRNGWKSQTRRPIYPQPTKVENGKLFRADGKKIVCPFGVAGDRLWVRERFAFADDESGTVIYAADDPRRMRFQQSQFMPRTASRMTLTIHGTRAQRLQEISEADARVEGFNPQLAVPARQWFAQLWDSLSPGEGLMWNDNPWVWVVHFSVVGRGENASPAAQHEHARLKSEKSAEKEAGRDAQKDAQNDAPEDAEKEVERKAHSPKSSGHAVRSATDEEKRKLAAMLKTPPS